MLRKICGLPLLAGLLSLVACYTHASKSAVFQVETGDKVEVQVDLQAGYDLTMELPFEIRQGDQVIFYGTFAWLDGYDTYYQLVAEDPNAELLAEESKDGNAYFFYTVNNLDSQITEYNYFVKVGNSQTVVIMGSTAAREAAFAATVISLAEEE